MGIIGAGGMPGRHADIYADNARSEVVCVCDIIEDKAREKSKQLDCDYTTDYRELINRSDVQAVLVGVPDALHYQMALDSLCAGKHTAVEYPIAQTVEQFDTLCRQADERKLVIHDALTPVIEPQPLMMRKLLDKIGKVLIMRSAYIGGGVGSWYVNSELRGNFFAALTIHMIVYSNLVLDQSPDWVDAAIHVSGRGKQSQHVGSYLYHYPSGVLGYNEWGMGFEDRGYWEWIIEGQRGRLIYERPENSAHHIRMVTTTSKQEVFEVEPQQVVHSKEVDNFLAEILDGAEPYTSRQYSRNILAICEAAQKSAETGQRIALS